MLFDDFVEHLKKNQPELNKTRCLLAISGGVDSMVLAYVFIKAEVPIALAHAHFGLRGAQSDKDAQFVKNFAEKHKIPFFIKRFNTDLFAKENKLSIQMAARHLRYDWFESLMVEYAYNKLVTAHHLDDSLETLLLNLMRSTSLPSLMGIQEQANVLRPFLAFSKAQIEEYAKKHHIDWREDASNQKEDYLRNFVRHKVIPPLKEISPNWEKSLRTSLRHLQEENAVLQTHYHVVLKQIRKEVKDVCAFNLDLLKLYEPLSTYVHRFFSGFGFHTPSVLNLIEKGKTGSFLRSDTHILLKNRNDLLVKPIQNQPPLQTEFLFKHPKDFANAPYKMAFSKNEFPLNRSIEQINASVLQFPLKLRKWQKGDFFYPLGLKHRQKVSKYFKDHKFSRFEKESSWLLINANGDVICIVGHRIDERYKVEHKTKKILYIQ